MKIGVLKFGGSALKDVKSIESIASIIQKKTFDYEGLVVVVSAMGKLTDTLISLALKIHPDPPQREYDMLISVGERVSMSLLAMALQRNGVQAISFTGSQSGIITSHDHASAKIIDVRPFRIWPHLEANRVVLVAGFQGVSEQKEITTLGRGGSDTTAVALAVSLKAQKVEFYKDVDGIYERDPKNDLAAKLFSSLDYNEAFKINEVPRPILNPRCIKLAEKNNMPLHVLSFKNSSSLGTLVGETNATSVSKINLKACFETSFDD